MTNIDVNNFFEQAKKDDGEWFLFKTIGDKIAGTFTGVRRAIDGYNNEQFVITLRNNGKNYFVGIRMTHKYTIEAIKQARYGQIVGFHYKEDKQVARGTTKVIDCIASTMLDEEWVAERVEQFKRMGMSPEDALRPNFDDTEVAPNASSVPTPTTVPVATTPVAPATPIVEAIPTATAPVVENPVLVSVRELAKSKGLAGPDMTREGIDAVIKNVTGLDVNEENAAQIITKIATTF